MEQKIIKIGNSLGVIIPQKILNKTGLKPGSPVIIEEGKIEGTLIVREKGSSEYSTTSLTPEFQEAVQRVHKKYGEALKELADK